jgi:hypothetical protein
MLFRLLAILILFSSVCFAQEQAIITHSTVITVTPTIDTSAYAANDAISPVLTLTGAGRETLSTMLQNITVSDEGGEGKTINIVVFDTVPTTTFVANSPFDPSDAEIDTIACIVTVSSHYSFSGGSNGASVANNVGCVIDTADGTAYAVAVATEAVTYDATDALTFRFHFIQD